MLAGSILMYAGTTAPSGFLMCDGSLVSRSTYSDLFDVIGTTYGSGDGSTTFALPNLSGRVPMGVSQDYALASSGGSETATLDSTSVPSHTHMVPSHGHANTILAVTPTYTHSITAQPAFNYSRPNQTNTAYTPATASSYVGTMTAFATLSTEVEIAEHLPVACTMSGSITDCAAFDTESTGSQSAEHNNMQPYVTMHYVIATGE